MGIPCGFAKPATSATPLPHRFFRLIKPGLANILGMPIIVDMTTETKSLSKNYTRNRPIRYTTSNALDTLHPAELLWVMREWTRFEGGPEDHDFNVICELKTPITQTRVWIVDRDADSDPMLMLPEDY